MEAIVLAGGFGTRLKSVISDIPKPMAPVNGKPFLTYILDFLQKNDVTRVILAVGYMHQVIQKHFGDAYKNIELLYSIEDEPLGTGGAIKKALEITQEKSVYILNGDTFFDINLKELKLKQDSKLAMSLKQMKNFARYGSVEIDDDGCIKTFKEKVFTKQGYINGGIYLMTKDIFSAFLLPYNFSFEKFMEDNFKTLNISTKVFDDYFIDIGIPEDYEKAKNIFK